MVSPFKQGGNVVKRRLASLFSRSPDRRTHVRSVLYALRSLVLTVRSEPRSVPVRSVFSVNKNLFFSPSVRPH